MLKIPQHSISQTAPLQTGVTAVATNPDLDVVQRPVTCAPGSGKPVSVGDITVTAGTAPTARFDSYTTPVRGTTFRTLTVAAPGVLANDSDPDTAGGQRLQASVTTPPARGKLTFAADGSFTYVPNTGTTGTDSFAYTVSDGLLTSAPVRAVITVPDQTPQAGGVAYTATAGRTLTVPAPGLAAKVVEPDGQAFTTKVATQPRSGTAVVNPDGSFSYTPNAGFSGDDQFNYYAVDSAGRTGIGTVVITVVPTS